MNTVYQLLATPSVNGNNFQKRTYKGTTTITYILSSIDTQGKIPIRIDANFADGETYTRYYDFLNDNTILLEPIIHTYRFKKNYNSNINNYNSYIRIFYSNFSAYTYYMPMDIYAESFYSEHNTLNITNSQFLDDSNNSLFIMMENSDGSVFNSIIK